MDKEPGGIQSMGFRGFEQAEQANIKSPLRLAPCNCTSSAEAWSALLIPGPPRLLSGQQHFAYRALSDPGGKGQQQGNPQSL